MADFSDWPMEAHQELYQTFDQLGERMRPFLETIEPKRRRGMGSEQLQELPNLRRQHVPDLYFLHLMIQQVASMALRHEQDLANLRSQDAFVLCLQVDQQGALPLIANKTEWWKQQRKEGKDVQPLRCLLVQTVFQELLSRVTKVQKDSSDPQKQEVWKTLRSRHLILEDGSWPFMKWDSQQNCLVQATEHRPLSMDAMTKMMMEVVEGLQAARVTQRFQAMSPIGPTGPKTIPWKLQLGIQQDDLINLLRRLCGSAALHLLGASMKQHHQHMRRQAQWIQQNLGKGRGKVKESK